jgi:hypothetical protein
LQRLLRDFATTNQEALWATLDRGLREPRTALAVFTALAELEARTTRSALAYRERVFSTPQETPGWSS